jgi:hypothetical protein
MWGYLSLFVWVVGLIVYFAAGAPSNPRTNPKVAEVGRLAFLVGLWVFLMQNGTHIFSLAGH